MNTNLNNDHTPDESLADRGVLRFITAGSVDDGKSTLIGRLLYDSRGILADQLDALARAGQRRGATITTADHAAIDLSLLTDGLEAEREQGITIDVAYRYFATARRKFIIADTPGHEQYTRNMVTGASTADAAVILIDATRVENGQLLPQTRRHTALAQLLGLRHLIVAVNKMDAVGYDQSRFDQIVSAYQQLAQSLGLKRFIPIPLSALAGDNVVHASSHMPWYSGPTLLQLLEELPAGQEADANDANADSAPLRFAVQWVQKGHLRRNAGARGYAGRVGSGRVKTGQAVRVLPAGLQATVAAIETFDGELEVALPGQSVSIRLDRELDISRGDVIVADDDTQQPEVTRSFDAELAWLDSESLAPQRRLWLRHGTRFVLARVRQVQQVLDLSTLQWKTQESAGGLAANDIGRVQIEVQQPLPVDDYAKVRSGGAFVLIDQATHRTVAAGMARVASSNA